MKLPCGAEAIVEIAKLRDYCLNPHHPRGGHKARVFLATLGLAQAGAEFLRGALIQAAREAEACRGDPMTMATGSLSILSSSEAITVLLAGAPGSYSGAKWRRG